jgi:uncharacterized protein YhaN
MMADSVKALNYAEDFLGVHKVYQEAISARQKLDKTLDALVGARYRKRELESSLVDREMELISEQRGIHPEFSATAMDAHMKRIKNADDDYREIREQISATTSTIDSLESNKTVDEVDIKIAVARLQELGGYFEYLAVIKQQQAHDAS